MKKAAEYWVKVYCDNLLIKHYNTGIALEGPSTLGRLVDFLGEIPRGSGYFFDTISIKADKMLSHDRANGEAERLMSLLTRRQHFSVCAWELLIGKPWPKDDKRVIRNGAEVAQLLSVDYKALNECRNRALDRINAELGFINA